jgi:putative NADPH-quinone reductase
VETLSLRDMTFDPILRANDANSQILEPDLLEAQRLIKNCQHLVVIYPTWWGSIPALLKGFVDRTFVPGFAFSYRTNSAGWDKLLSGRTARLITTMDAPSWYDRFFYGRPAINQLEKATLAFCGVRTIGRHIHARVRKSSPDTRTKWISQIEALGRRDSC